MAAFIQAGNMPVDVAKKERERDSKTLRVTSRAKPKANGSDEVR